jgi:hypothetical protein
MTHRQRKLYIISLCLAAGAATTTGVAVAKWTRTTPWACHVTSGTPLDTSWALQNDSTVSELVALCPIVDSDYLLKENVVTANIHVRDGHSGASARALLCESNYATAGGACSAQVSSGDAFVGNTTLSPSTGAVWSTATQAYFGYIFVGIPAKSGVSRSNIRGYFTAD